MTRCKKCFSLDEDTVQTITRISAQKGVPESELANNFLISAISKSVELTSAERYHFRRNSINKALDSVLRLFGILEFNGGAHDKYRAALYMAQGNQRAKNREYRNGIIETSLFEVLEQIREWDNNIWKDITITMSRFGKIRLRYFYLYPKCVKKGMKPKNEELLYTNNTTINNLITNTNNTSKEETSLKTHKKKSKINKFEVECITSKNDKDIMN